MDPPDRLSKLLFVLASTALTVGLGGAFLHTQWGFAELSGRHSVQLEATAPHRHSLLHSSPSPTPAGACERGRLERHADEPGHGDVCRDGATWWGCPLGCDPAAHRRPPYCTGQGAALPPCRAGGEVARRTVPPMRGPAELWRPWELHRAAGPPTFVTVKYNKGRSGHMLKDVATAFVLAQWMGWAPCALEQWSSKAVRLFAPAFAIPACEATALGIVSLHQSVFRGVPWEGMSFDDVVQLGARTRRAAQDVPVGAGFLLVLDGSTRVQMDALFSWEAAGRMPHAVFEPVRRTLQARWFHRMAVVSRGDPAVRAPPPLLAAAEGPACARNTDPAAECVTCLGVPPPPPRRTGTTIVAHFRRGDIAGAMANLAWSDAAFARRLVAQLRLDFAGCPTPLHITLITEKNGAQDLKRAKVPGIDALVSGESWEHDMMEFVNADVLVVANSSMSTWAALFGRGLVLVPSGYAKHFNFAPRPQHLAPFVNRTELAGLETGCASLVPPRRRWLD